MVTFWLRSTTLHMNKVLTQKKVHHFAGKEKKMRMHDNNLFLPEV